MGCSVSKEAVVVSASASPVGCKPQDAAPTTNNSVSSSNQNNMNSPISKENSVHSAAATAALTNHFSERGAKWAANAGYSSGASSSVPDGDNNEAAAPSHKHSGSCMSLSRHGDIVSSLKLEMETASPDLTKKIVRMETPLDTPIEEMYDGVWDGPELGQGVAGIVRKVKHRATGVYFACKCLDTGLIDSEEAMQQLRNEVSIMCQLDHPNIVRIEEVYQSPDRLFIIQELCTGGELFDRLEEQRDYHYSEAECARLVKQMLNAVRYLHRCGIVHRDLKLENFLFSSPDPTSELRMIDFGLSKHFVTGQHHCEMVGTPYTVAPEIISGDYDEKVDIWALGVITYLLLSGETPFGGLDGESLVLVKNNIIRGQVVFKPKEIWDGVSDSGKAFVKRMLHPDPKLRPTARELQLDPWIQIYAKKDAKEGTRLKSKTVNALIAFKESSEMQKLLSEILSFTLQPEQIIELRKEFEKIDEDGDGEISLTAMQKVLMRNAGAGTLGTLEEHEVEEIFESIKIRKAATTLRWHEFLAAGLSQAKVDDRNLRLAFDRLDSQRKGFLTLDDLSEVLGGSIELKDLEIIWLSSLKDCKAHPDRITFTDFKALMNGRPKKGTSVVTPLDVVMEQNRPDSCRDVPRHGDFETNEAHHVLHSSSSRSQSQKGSNAFWDGSSDSKESRTHKTSSSCPLARCEDGESTAHFVDNDPTLLATKRDLFRKRLEMRLAVLEASKNFDKKLKDMNRIISPRRAGLIMKRANDDCGEDQFAPLRSIGRNASTTRTRPDRKKTVSDVTGLFK